MSLSLDELQRFAPKSTTATLTCAGNRRSEFNKEGEVGGVQWEAGAIGNATWTGVSLANVLQRAEVSDGAKHVWFEGLDEIPKGDGIIPFGASIPIQKAMVSGEAGEVLIAHTMNGVPLTPDHGYPLRTVVPGYIGARSVKWLGKIVVSDRPSPNHYVATAYKLVKQTEPLDWMESSPIYRFPINAAICSPALNSQVAAGVVNVSGYVLPSGRPRSRTEKVFVSGDMGKSWQKAELSGEYSEFCWQLWTAQVEVAKTTKQLIVRATDSSGGFMPYRVPWNAKGYLQNSWFKLPIKVG
jgi:sulfite oxidase